LDPFIAEDSVGVTCQTSLQDGEDGYPGDLDVTVTYILQAPSTMVVRYTAISSADTLFNPTQHTYFNLDAERGTILDHDLMIKGASCLETDASLIPSGRLVEVNGTRLDFNASRSLRGLSQPGQSLDHSWVLMPRERGEVIASLSSARSGRRVDVITDAPTLHVYAGHGLQADTPTSNRKSILPFSGLCLETQGYADAPNHPEFPSIVLPAGREWKSETTFRFSTDAATPAR
jgi:aldose 1-epimerase